MPPAVLHTLILEDEQDHARLLELELRRIAELEFDVARCASIAEAIKQVDTHHYDLIFTDYWLDGETCEVFLDQLSQNGVSAAVVVTTAANDEYVAASVTRSGAHRYIKKDDLSSSMLRETIREAMRDSQRDRQALVARQDAQDRLKLLTAREREIAGLIAEGMLSKQIAYTLGCTEGTVNLHRSHIMAKTQARSVADLVRLVIVATAE